MPKRDVVVIGASAGGVEALRTLLSLLPVDFPAAIAVVLHVPATGTSALPSVLGRVTDLKVRHARRDDLLTPGEVLIAPADHHLLVFDHAVTLSRGPRENGHRPAIDVLFRTAARALGPRVVGVVLSGALDDGSAGLVAVHARGGVCVVQDPEDALVPSMPLAAIAADHVQHIEPLEKMADVLVRLVGEEVSDEVPPVSELMKRETDMAYLDGNELDNEDRPGSPAGLSCPDCHGPLYEIEEEGYVRFRCRVGHAFSPESLVAEQAAGLEGALWMALRSLEEKAALARRLGNSASERGHALTRDGFESMAHEAWQAASTLRKLIDRLGGAGSTVDPSA